MSPYREGAEQPEVAVPHGLVRANGSPCRCCPPGFFWCLWFSVVRGDRWYCAHGGGWMRERDGAAPFFPMYWAPLKESEAGRG